MLSELVQYQGKVGIFQLNFYNSISTDNTTIWAESSIHIKYPVNKFLSTLKYWQVRTRQVFAQTVTNNVLVLAIPPSR